MTEPEKFSVRPSGFLFNSYKLTDFSILQFGGTVSSYPSLKTSGKSIINLTFDREAFDRAHSQAEHPEGEGS